MAPPLPLILARQAMATRFEIVLHGGHPAALRAAAEEAFEEIARIEALLSAYRPDSEISRVNACAHQRPVRVSPLVFQLLEHCRRLWEETQGAFDITLLPLLRCWDLAGGPGRVPGEEELTQARQRVGMEHVRLDEAACTVEFGAPGMMLDLGAVGKGYALDRAVTLLREAGMECGLIHGGTSSVYGFGHPPDQEAWRVALELPGWLVSGIPANPERSGQSPMSVHSTPDATTAGRVVVAVVELRDASLSVSASWGKAFRVGDELYGHILDPSTGAPAKNAIMAAVVWPFATEGDALSTALMVRGIPGQERLHALRPSMRSLVTVLTESEVIIRGVGITSLAGVRLSRR